MNLVRSSGCRKQRAEKFIVREVGDPPQSRCKKEDPGKVFTSPSLGPTPIMMEPSRFVLLHLRARSSYVPGRTRSDGSEKECNLGQQLGWVGQSSPTSCLLNPVCLLSCLPPIRAKMTAFPGFWCTTPAIFPQSSWLCYNEKSLMNWRQPQPAKWKCLPCSL